MRERERERERERVYVESKIFAHWTDKQIFESVWMKGERGEGVMEEREEGYSPVAQRVDEVETAVDTMVFDVPSVET